jgi:hypothetical protein
MICTIRTIRAIRIFNEQRVTKTRAIRTLFRATTLAAPDKRHQVRCA